jgi:hypothetical protein
MSLRLHNSFFPGQISNSFTVYINIYICIYICISIAMINHPYRLPNMIIAILHIVSFLKLGHKFIIAEAFVKDSGSSCMATQPFYSTMNRDVCR